MQLKNNCKKYILIVDDEPEIRHTMKIVIEGIFGDLAEVIQAENGFEATSLTNSLAFDCIITDLHMPKKAGEAFITSVRQNTLNDATPVIILSGVEMGVRVADQFNFVYYIPKPCEFKFLTELLALQLNIVLTQNNQQQELSE